MTWKLQLDEETKSNYFFTEAGAGVLSDTAFT
jgi:hypothetical protein